MKRAEDNAKKASYRKSEDGRLQHIQQQQRNRERKRGQKQALSVAIRDSNIA